MAQFFRESTDVVAVLKACAKGKDLHKGIKVHAHILRRGLLEKNCYVASTLVSMYAKCGALAKAAQVLHKLPVRDVFSWSALITGYAQQGQGEIALRCFERMQHEGLSPDRVTFIGVLKACGSIRAADKGKHIHDVIVSQGLLENDIVLANTLVDMYVKCGELSKAEQVLDELPLRDVVSWNALMAGYAQQGQGEEALKCLQRMKNEGHSPDTVTFICTLKACGSLGTADKGQATHDEIVRQGLLEKDTVLGNALVDMYVKCGALAKAVQVLEELPVRNVVSWNTLMAGYAQQGQGEKALRCLERMLGEGLSPDSVTFMCILKACGTTGAADKGKQVHDELVRQGLLGKDVVLGNALVDMYAKCGALAKAASVLEELDFPNVVSWNALIAGYTQQGQGEEALECFERMQLEGFSADTVTFNYILKACSSIGSADKVKQIHDIIVRHGMLGNDIVLGSTLVDMYAKLGALEKAAQVLEELPVRDVVTWSALIAGYAHQGHGEEALKCFRQMQHEGLSPDRVTFISTLKACGTIGAVDKGEEVHDKIVRGGLLGNDVVLGNALVDMYAKCGALSKAARVLDELLIRDVVSWNALIAGYAQQGQGEEALTCFERMQCEGFSPDTVTSACLLSACSRSGLLDEGETYFTKMSTKYGIRPDLEHHTCMVDLFGRVGEFDKALAVIKKMPSFDHLPVWHALLGACRECGNVMLGRLAFDKAIQAYKNDTAAYVLMTRIYTAAGMQESASKLEEIREKQGRKPGSWRYRSACR